MLRLRLMFPSEVKSTAALYSLLGFFCPQKPGSRPLCHRGRLGAMHRARRRAE